MDFLRSVRLFALLLFTGGCLISGIPSRCCSEILSPCPCNTTQGTPEGALEYEMLTLTNQYRALQGLYALVPDEKLIKIAREHSLEMARQGFISHELPSGDLHARMSRGSFDYEIARENIAASSSVTIAQSAFVESAPHKRNLLSSDIERIGIGIIRCPPPRDKQLFITQIFANPRSQYKTEAVQEMVLRSVDDLRKSGAGPLVPDRLLERLASDSVETLNIPIKQEELRNLLANSAGELHRGGRGEMARIDASVQVVHNPRSFKIPNWTRTGRKASAFGTAIRQLTEDNNQPAYLVLTLIGFTD